MRISFILFSLLLMASACTSSTSTHPCPIATPEALLVDLLPVTTDQLSIIVHVLLGHMEEIKVVTESGTFTSTTSDVTVILMPNTVHHLEVFGKVEIVEGRGGCQYGGYTLSTKYDKDFNPLVIEQKNP